MRSNNQVNNPNITGSKGSGLSKTVLPKKGGMGNNRTTFLMTDYGDQRGITPVSKERAVTVANGDKELEKLRTPI